MRERRLILDQQLSQLEAEKRSIEDGIQEITRRLAVLGEVEGWNLLTEPADAADYTATDQVEHDIEVGPLNGSATRLSATVGNGRCQPIGARPNPPRLPE